MSDFVYEPEVELSQSILWVVAELTQVQPSYFAQGEDQPLLLGPEEVVASCINDAFLASVEVAARNTVQVEVGQPEMDDVDAVDVEGVQDDAETDGTFAYAVQAVK